MKYITSLCISLLALSSFVVSSERHNIYNDEYERYLEALEDHSYRHAVPQEVREEISLYTSPVTPRTSPLRRTNSHRSFDTVLHEATSGEALLGAAMALRSVEHVYAYVVVMDHLRGYPVDPNLMEYPSVRELLIGHNVINTSGLFRNNIVGGRYAN